MLRLIVASVAFFAAWSWLRAGFAAATAQTDKPASGMLLRGLVFAAVLVWWALALADMVGWVFCFAIVGGVVWFLNASAPKQAREGGPSSSPPPAGDADT